MDSLTKNGKNVVKELEMVGGAYYNNVGIKAFKLEDGKVFMQKYKLQRKVLGHSSEIDLDYFVERFRDETKLDVDLFNDACEFLNPDYHYHTSDLPY